MLKNEADIVSLKEVRRRELELELEQKQKAEDEIALKKSSGAKTQWKKLSRVVKVAAVTKHHQHHRRQRRQHHHRLRLASCKH